MRTFVLLCAVAALFAFSAEVLVQQPKAAGNPFEGATMFVNPDYQAEVDSSIKDYPTEKDLLEKARDIPAAFWMDSMSKIPEALKVLEGAKAAGDLTIFVVYDLPNRDCAAAASNGEILCENSACAAGLNTYKTKYIDPIVAMFKRFPNQTIVGIVEPDSLPNLATNLAIQKCAEAQTAYTEGVAYAIQQLSTLSNVHLYVDAAHGGWLGWPDNLKKASAVFSKVLNLAGGFDKIRGFATNVANYQPLGSMSSTADPCKLKSQYNNAINEVIYTSLLSQALEQVGISGKSFVIDTSRNGDPDTRQDCSNWCNIKGSGLGIRPTTNTQSVGVDNIDAFIYVKVPGESDGTTNTTSTRYDFHCRSEDSIIPAPEAGQWFSSDFLSLCKNAVPAL